MTYDLSPEPSKQVPPEETVAVPEPGRRPRRSVSAEIKEDLPCVTCGYNLRGLTGKHRCPECGTPAGFSRAGDLLQYAPIPWLRTVRNGLAMLLWSLGASLGASIAAVYEPR